MLIEQDVVWLMLLFQTMIRKCTYWNSTYLCCVFCSACELGPKVEVHAVQMENDDAKYCLHVH